MSKFVFSSCLYIFKKKQNIDDTIQCCVKKLHIVRISFSFGLHLLPKAAQHIIQETLMPTVVFHFNKSTHTVLRVEGLTPACCVWLCGRIQRMFQWMKMITQQPGNAFLSAVHVCVYVFIVWVCKVSALCTPHVCTQGCVFVFQCVCVCVCRAQWGRCLCSRGCKPS